MSTNITEILNLLSTVNNTGFYGNIGSYGNIGNVYQTGTSFGNALQNQLVNRMKQEIYNQFQINVGGYNEHYSCYIPSNVLCRMNTDKALKEKVFNMLEKYSGEEFKESIMAQEPSVKKCTLTFDEQGEATVTLKTSEKQSQTDQNAMLLYQKYFMQQAALMSYKASLYGGYNNLYGLNGFNNYNMLQNSLFSSILGNL